MRKFDYFWQSNKDWYHMNDNYIFVVNDDAPPEAQKSYKHYLKQQEDWETFHGELDNNKKEVL